MAQLSSCSFCAWKITKVTPIYKRWCTRALQEWTHLLIVTWLHLEKARETKVSNCLSSNNLSFQGMLAAVAATYLQPARGYSNTSGFLPRVGLEVFCSMVTWTSAFPAAFMCWLLVFFPAGSQAGMWEQQAACGHGHGPTWAHIPGTGQSSAPASPRTDLRAVQTLSKPKQSPQDEGWGTAWPKK